MKKCYNMIGYMDPKTKRTHSTICEYCDADEKSGRFICTARSPNITLFVKRLRATANGLVIKYIDPPVQGCPNKDHRVIVIGKGLDE